MARMFPRAIHNTQEAAEQLRDLAGDATYRQLLERHPDVTNSLGAWHGWLTGSRDPRLSNFLEAVEALGGEVIIGRSQPSSRAPIRAGRRGSRGSSNDPPPRVAPGVRFRPLLAATGCRRFSRGPYRRRQREPPID